MIWRLTYCNKNGVEARIDIIKGNRTPVEIVQGSGNPFTLSYKLDKNDKSGHIMTSSADIEIFETETFNIDDLKTSNETELKVEYFEDNVVKWIGFIIPDFFSREISGNAVVSMTASDRLGTLKSASLSDLPSMMTLRDLAISCLTKTGLSLSLKTMVDISNGTNNNDFFNSKILTQRLSDTKGRNISCYDVLSSILTASNSLLTQRNGEWYIVNKYQHEIGVGKLYNTATTSTNWSDVIHDFSEITVGGRRTIVPVASSVGVYQEFGGGRIHSENYDFAQGASGWVAVNEFPYAIEDKQIKSYQRINNVWTVNTEGIDKNRLKVNKVFGGSYGNTDLIGYVQNTFPVISANENSVKISINLSILGRPLTTTRIMILAENETKRYAFNNISGVFEPYAPQKFDSLGEHIFMIKLMPPGEYPGNEIYFPGVKSVKYDAEFNATDVKSYSISIRVFGTDSYNARVIPTFINFAGVIFSNTEEAPRGTLFKTEQGSNFTKAHDLETSIFGDYLTNGLNGYFYDYPKDDSSSLFNNAGVLTNNWTTPTDTEGLPLLQHISRQKSRMFSVAHDLLTAEIKIPNFDPLAIFRDCKGERYVIVSASFDFLRSAVDVELEQIAYDNAIFKRDYIYSYFGEGESNIKSIGGIAGGGGSGGGGGGGMTSEQLEMLTNLADWWKLDEENDAIYSEKSVYSLKGVSALGYNDDDDGSGGGVDMLDYWANYTPDKANYYAPASLLVTFRDDTLNRLASLEAGGGGGGGDVEIYITGSGNAVTGVSKSGSTLTFTKGNTFSLSTHNHDTIYKPIGYVPSWSEITNKPTTFAPSAHTHTIANVTGLQTALNSKQDTLIAGANITISGNTISASGGISSVAWGDITGKPTTFAPSAHTHSASDITSGTLALARIPTGTTSSTVALGNHLHAGVYEPVFTKNAAFNKNFGTTAGTVSQGNDSRILNGQTAYGWGNHSSAGYALNSALTAHINKVDNPHSVTKAQVGLGSVDNTADSAKNVLSATKLTTARTIWGQSFNGTGNVSGALTGVTSISMNNTLTGATTIEALTSITTPKVIFKTAGWSMEQSVEGVLELKYNGVIKQKFLNDGSIAATGELTAYVAGASGYSEFLPLSGGTLTGNLNIGTGVIIGTAATPLSVRGSTFKYNNSDVLYKGNIGTALLPSIGLSDGWTIEVQTTPSSALLIKKNGVIKGTFNG